MRHVRAVSDDEESFVPSAALLELDWLLKSEGVTYDDRKNIFNLLCEPIPKDKILWVTPEILKRVAEWDGVAKWDSHYFDVMIAAVAEANNAEVVTTDQEIPALGVKTSW